MTCPMRRRGKEGGSGGTIPTQGFSVSLGNPETFKADAESSERLKDKIMDYASDLLDAIDNAVEKQSDTINQSLRDITEKGTEGIADTNTANPKMKQEVDKVTANLKKGVPQYGKDLDAALDKFEKSVRESLVAGGFLDKV